MMQKLTTAVYSSYYNRPFPSTIIVFTTKWLFALHPVGSRQMETKHKGNISPFSLDTDDGVQFTRILQFDLQAEVTRTEEYKPSLLLIHKISLTALLSPDVNTAPPS